tara:strand:- start:2956 stop:3246 length:291 start_codon:yes stop_codon:yes gene_type:complete
MHHDQRKYNTLHIGWCDLHNKHRHNCLDRHLKVASVKEAITRLEAHEKECAIRYQNIEQRLESGAKRFDRLENLLWGMYPTVIGTIISVVALMKWI